MDMFTPSTPSPTDESTPSEFFPTTRSSDTYVYGAGMLTETILAIGVCVFFVYKTFQANKNQVNKKQDQQPKRRYML